MSLKKGFFKFHSSSDSSDDEYKSRLKRHIERKESIEAKKQKLEFLKSPQYMIEQNEIVNKSKRKNSIPVIRRMSNSSSSSKIMPVKSMRSQKVFEEESSEDK